MGRRPVCRQAWMSFKLPSTLASASSIGCSTETRTLACAAWCETTVTPRSRKRASRPSSRRSRSTSSAAEGTFSRRPVERLSSTMTRCPSARAPSARWLPMKPAPPAMRSVSGMRVNLISSRPLAMRSSTLDLAPLPLDFYRRPAEEVAPDLLGRFLVRRIGRQRLVLRLVEVEAYLGATDRAAHAWNGRRTARNESLYLPGGHAYVYFIYGMHWCLNVVCGEKDEGGAVLL